MLYDMYGELINFVVINIDNTEINEAYSRLAEFESSFSLVSRFGKVGYCLLYTSDAADERSSVDLGGRRIIKKKKKTDVPDTHSRKMNENKE